MQQWHSWAFIDRAYTQQIVYPLVVQYYSQVAKGYMIWQLQLWLCTGACGLHTTVAIRVGTVYVGTVYGSALAESVYLIVYYGRMA